MKLILWVQSLQGRGENFSKLLIKVRVASLTVGDPHGVGLGPPAEWQHWILDGPGHSPTVDLALHEVVGWQSPMTPFEVQLPYVQHCSRVVRFSMSGDRREKDGEPEYLLRLDNDQLRISRHRFCKNLLIYRHHFVHYWLSILMQSRLRWRWRRWKKLLQVK